MTARTITNLILIRSRSGKQDDVLVQSGDVIVVNKSIPGAVPFLVYALFNRLSAGVYASPF